MRPETAQLHAALLTQPGLEAIDESFAPFGMPFFLENDNELDYVIDKMTPFIRQRLTAKGFHLLHWGNAGWVQLFSKQPVRTLADLKKARLYTTEGFDKIVQWYKSNGFNPVPLAYNDIPAQLKTGVIDAAPAPPYGALALRFHLDAKHMLDLRVAPLVGATVVRTEVWSKLSEADRAEIEKIAADVEKTLHQQVPKLDATSIKEMEAAGLSVTKVDGAALTEFRTAAEKLTATMRGNMVPADIFDMAMKYRSEVRKTK
jgi:TRAP-type C4-dicarboxylate transport system substrate-binding protein